MTDEAANLGGRPTKYEDWIPAKVVELMRDGASKHEVAAELGICPATLFNWQNDPEKPDFAEAMRKGVALSQAWWECQGRKAVRGEIQHFAASTYIFTMKNRFGWRDKKDIELSGPEGGAITTASSVVTGEELKAMIKQAEQDV